MKGNLTKDHKESLILLICGTYHLKSIQQAVSELNEA